MREFSSDDLRQRQARSQRGFYRALGDGAEGSRAVDLAHGVQATIVPVRPWFSIFNATVYDDAPALRQALESIDEAYRSAGVGGWSVWTRPGDRQAGDLLAQAGSTQEGAALVMGAPLGDLDVSPQRELDLMAGATWHEIASCNDRAHGVLPEFNLGAAFAAIHDPDAHL